MIRSSINIVVIILFILTSCASHQFQKDSASDIPLEQLLHQLPARDSVESTLVFNAILKYGEQGIVDISRSLSSANHQKRISSEYALHGLANYVTSPDREDYRKMYVSGISAALEMMEPIRQKSFLIDQMKIAGEEESVQLLASYISHPKLYESAIQALTAIGTNNAGFALMEALTFVEGDIKIAVIQALGNMRFDPASEALVRLLADQEEQIKKACAHALANIGVQKAVLPLKTLAQSDINYAPCYLELAARLAEKGEITSCLEICNDIIKQKHQNYPENSVVNALHLQVLYNPQEALSNLYNVISGDNRRIRLEAMDLIKTYECSDYVPALIQLSHRSVPAIQTDIIMLFGVEKCEASLPFIEENLQSPISEIQLKSLQALSEIDMENALPHIVSVLKDSLDDDETSLMQTILETIYDSSHVTYLLKLYDKYPPSSKSLVLKKVTEYLFRSGEINTSDYSNIYVSSLKSSNPQLRMASLKGLELIGDESVLKELLLFLLNASLEKEQTGCIRALKTIINRSQSKRETRDLITEYYNSVSNEDKILLFNLMKSIGGEQFRNIVVRAASADDENLRYAALRALSDWPDDTALDDLIEIATTTEEDKSRILAQRGTLRILKTTPMGDQRAVQYYGKLMESNLRPEEKRQVLSGLADVKTTSSLELIASLLNDPIVSKEANLAVVSFYQDEELTSQPPPGFKSLFNGINLEGWKGLVENPIKRARMSEEELQKAQVRADSLMKEHWHVLDGILYFDGKGSHLCTVDDYTDFELYIDWKIERDGDSGIYLRGSPQVQIWDPATNNEGSGGLYNNKIHPNAPHEVSDNPVGEWNTFYIIMRGNKVTVYLNDTLVVDNVEMENYWERDKPIYASGQIELQSHNTPLYFRNIYIRELEPEEQLFEGALFNGMNLEGWQVIGNKKDTWQVKNNVLYTEAKGGGWISTKDEYKDFELEFEYRIPEEGNSGVFLRSKHEGEPWIDGMEIQLLDDQAEIHSELKTWQYTGSLYGIQGPDYPKSKKHGQWQKMKIYCVGPVIKVTLNDELINEINLIDYMDMEETNPGIKRRQGFIGLQNHDTKIEFRHIKIREIQK